MLTSVNNSLMSASRFEKSQRRVGISGFEHPVSRIREHIGRPHALQHVVVGNDNQGLGR